MKVIFEKSTFSLRQMPENYLLAYLINGRWIVEPDLSANKELAIKTFKIVALIHTHKYISTGEYLANIINN